MAKKNEILLSIALDGDSEVKRKLADVGETGKRSLDNIGRRLDAARAGGGLDGVRKSADALREALAPLSEASGLGGLLGGGGGILSRLFKGLTSPAGIVGTIGAGIASLVELTKVGDEMRRVQGRLSALGDDKGLDRLTERAKAAGAAAADLQPRYERFLALQQKINAGNPAISHPPGYQPGALERAAASVQVFNGGQQLTPPSEENFGKFDSALLAQIRRDVKSAEEARGIADQFLEQLSSTGLTPDLLRALQKSSPSAAKFLTSQFSKTLGQGFENPAAFAAAIERGRVPQQQLNATAVINAGARPNEAAAKAALDSQSLDQKGEALKASILRLPERFAGQFGIGKALDFLTKSTDALPDDLASAGKNVGGFVDRLKGYFGRAEPLPVRPTYVPRKFGDEPPPLPTVTYGTAAGSEELSKVAADQSKAAEKLSKAADDLSKFANRTIDGVTYPGQSAPMVRDDGRIFKDLTTHSGSYPNVQVFGSDGQAPKSISEMNQSLRDGGIVNEWEADQQAAFTKSIRQQLGLPTEDNRQRGIVPHPNGGTADLSERMYPGGPYRYRFQPSPGYQPPTEGTYDQDMNFVPNKQQRRPEVLPQVFDFKGSGDLFPTFNSGSPMPLDFPAYMKFLRNTLPDEIPLPRPRPLDFAAGGRIDATGGGSISGPGTGTSDSVPLFGSNGEYVFKAKSASKIGLEILDYANEHGQLPGYADGGQVLPSALSSMLPGGSYDISATDDGGAIINGTFYPPGSPILSEPAVRQQLARARAQKSQDSGSKHKSDFVGLFGGHNFDTPGSYARGGAIGSIASRGFALGGTIDVPPHLALGGALPDSISGPAPSLGDLNSGGSPWDGVKHLGSADLRTDHGDVRAIGPADTLRHMISAARDSADVQTGPRPSWYRGK
jgi:hypothetical protein